MNEVLESFIIPDEPPDHVIALALALELALRQQVAPGRKKLASTLRQVVKVLRVRFDEIALAERLDLASRLADALTDVYVRCSRGELAEHDVAEAILTAATEAGVGISKQTAQSLVLRVAPSPATAKRIAAAIADKDERTRYLATYDKGTIQGLGGPKVAAREMAARAIGLGEGSIRNSRKGRSARHGGGQDAIAPTSVGREPYRRGLVDWSIRYPTNMRQRFMFILALFGFTADEAERVMCYVEKQVGFPTVSGSPLDRAYRRVCAHKRSPFLWYSLR